MFAARTKVLLKNLGAEGDLIYNENVNETIRMLTLVKVRQRKFWPINRYTIIDLTLLDLQEDADVCPGFTQEVLMEDFENLRGRCGGGCADAEAYSAKVSLNRNVDIVDGASSFTLMKKTVDIDRLRKSCTNRKINEKMVSMLRLKQTEKLTFVYQIVYNTERVDFFVKAGQEGSVSAAFKSFFTLSVSERKKEETRFSVPQKSTFAYGLMEITTGGGTLGIPPRTRNVRHFNKGWWNISSDAEEEDDCAGLRQAKTEMKMKEHLLQPLEDLPDSTRLDLLKTLSEVVEDRRALTLLQQTLDQDSTGACERPQPPSVSSFMDILTASNVSTSQKDAVHLLISAVDSLPGDVAAPLTSCCPHTLTVLNQLVDGLMEDGEAKLPQSLPPPLQEEGELRWAAELLCSTNQTLTELSEQWDSPEVPPGVLLEVLSLVVRGLSLMQRRTHL